MALINCRLDGRVDEVPGRFYVATRFWRLGFFPLIPLGSQLVRDGTEEAGEGFARWLGVPIPLSRRSVLWAWIRALPRLAAALGATAGVLTLAIDPEVALGQMLAAAIFSWLAVALPERRRATLPRALQALEQAGLREELGAQIERDLRPSLAIRVRSIFLGGLATAALAGAAAACGGTLAEEPADSGSPEIDGGSTDAGETADASPADSGRDASLDVGPVDAGAPVLCTAKGIPGTCLDVSECIGSRQPTPGLCPGPANIQCCTPRYAMACDPNAVPEPNAGLAEEPGTGSCPAGMVRVASFCVDRFEAALEEILAGGSRVPWSPYFNPAGHRVAAVSLRGAVPQGYVSQVQAAAACAEAGKRLCTDAEWLRACQGPNGWTYPYGTTRQTGLCNDHRAEHPAAELYGTGASWIFSHLDSPCLNQLPQSLDPTGSLTGCASAEGVYDLMGNLHEWTADPAGTFRGGFYVDTVLNGNGCLYATTAHAVSYWDYSTGFRCCHD